MLIDYHLHNHFSPDSDTDTKALIERMRELGIKHICITNHGEWFDHDAETAGVFDYAEVRPRFLKAKKEIEDLRPAFPDMDIGFGIELQYQPESEAKDGIKKLIDEMQFDFILGSVHLMEGFVISGGKHAAEFFKGKTEEQAYTAYFETLLYWVKTGDFNVTAHFDVIKKYGVEYYGPFNPQKYKPIIIKILQEMKAKGIGMELNTGSLHKRCEELFPHPDILKWCVEIGIENYTLGSDAHKLHELGRHLDEALTIAKEVGIRELPTYEKRVPTKHKI
jgi:histidinol-phosphatase (PHP family)